MPRESASSGYATTVAVIAHNSPMAIIPTTTAPSAAPSRASVTTPRIAIQTAATILEPAAILAKVASIPASKVERIASIGITIRRRSIWQRDPPNRRPTVR